MSTLLDLTNRCGVHCIKTVYENPGMFNRDGDCIFYENDVIAIARLITIRRETTLEIMNKKDKYIYRILPKKRAGCGYFALSG